MALIEHVRALEKRDNRGRGDYVIRELRALNIVPAIQESHHPRVRNIIVDSTPPDGQKRILFSAHFDAVKGSPGANDNASGVAVLLGLCRELTSLALSPVRIVFFDREEAWFRTPWLKLGLLGSLYYVNHSGAGKVSAVYNLEYVGAGDFMGIWPVTPRQRRLPAVVAAEKAAAKLNLPRATAHLPWPVISSDHLSFRLKGLHNAITLSLLPSDQAGLLKEFAGGLRILSLMGRRRPALPSPLSVIHSAADTSDRLSEDSLRLMLTVVREIVAGS